MIKQLSILGRYPLYRRKSVKAYLYRVGDEVSGEEFFVTTDGKGTPQSCTCRQNEKESRNLCPHLKWLEKRPKVIIDGSVEPYERMEA